MRWYISTSLLRHSARAQQKIVGKPEQLATPPWTSSHIPSTCFGVGRVGGSDGDQPSTRLAGSRRVAFQWLVRRITIDLCTESSTSMPCSVLAGRSSTCLGGVHGLSRRPLACTSIQGRNVHERHAASISSGAHGRSGDGYCSHLGSPLRRCRNLARSVAPTRRDSGMGQWRRSAGGEVR